MKRITKYYYSWTQLKFAVEELAKKLKPIKFNYVNIYGVPRGGLIIAVMLSHLLDLPIILDKKLITKNTLLVDDISDSGNTLKKILKLKKPKSIVTVWANPISKVFPDYYINLKEENTWIVFPWETIKSSKYDKTI